MRKIAHIAIAATVLFGASMAAATTYSSSSGSANAPTITGPSTPTDLAIYIPTSTMPKGSTITGIQYSYGQYANGNTKQTVQLCYAPNGTDWTCVDISGNSSTTINAFQGNPSNAKYKMIFTLTDGTYPASGGFSNTLKVGFKY